MFRFCNRGLDRPAFGQRSVVHCENYLADFDLLTLLYTDVFDHAAYRGRHLDDRLISLQFHDRLTFRNRGARCDHQAHEIALVHIFA